MKKAVVSYSLTLALVAASLSVYHHLLAPKIAFVDSARLMVGFSEAAGAEKELQVQDEKWKGQLKVLQDSLQASIDFMSKEYDRAPAARKKELQDILSARNQQVNNFRQANLQNLEKLRKEKMQSVFDKINVFLVEFGRKHHYRLILGTAAGGSILYGDSQRCDITDEITKGLNERYK